MKRGTCSDKQTERVKKKSKIPGLTSKVVITCDYCNKDITQSARILCAVCVEFDLCVECFSAGVELRGHKYWHNYRVVEDLRFSFLTPEWSAQEEQLLLEALEMYGISNWAYVADYVSTKDEKQCRLHFEECYLDSPGWPNHNFDHVHDSRFLNSSKHSKCPQLARRQRRAAARKLKKPTKKPTPQTPVSAVRHDLSGYMPLRKEFECEWDDDCEQKIMDIEFTENDTEEEYEFKMRLLEVYNARLAKRHAIRKMVVDKNLHDVKYQKSVNKSRTPEEQALHKEMKKYLRLMDNQEYEEFIRGLANQRELEKRVRELQECRAAGLTKLEDVPQYARGGRTKTKSRTQSRSSTPPSSPHNSTPPRLKDSGQRRSPSPPLSQSTSYSFPPLDVSLPHASTSRHSMTRPPSMNRPSSMTRSRSRNHTPMMMEVDIEAEEEEEEEDYEEQEVIKPVPRKPKRFSEEPFMHGPASHNNFVVAVI
eukprot:TRINITY_DN523_c2_g1_i1.p1 TRINITY_DN523_c2_g1~~TRINITY_DN523_c2_g1_i1.p1  ORF type:complete len:479 (+),score=82.59 TRINITY_DN523_c2_g1_i1:153-1589(+)